MSNGVKIKYFVKVMREENINHKCGKEKGGEV